MLNILRQMGIFTMLVFSMRGQAFDSLSMSPEENVTKSLSVVEVLGALKGTGVIIYLDDKPVIITNSHNIQGKKNVTIRLTHRKLKYLKVSLSPTSSGTDFEFNEKANVLMDFPLSDFAVVGFPVNLTKEERDVINMYARSNGQIIKNKWYPKKTANIFHESISAVLEGVPTSLTVVAPFKGRLIEDSLISGDGQNIWHIPIYARPGVSGGAYYRRGRLEGLVTKISLSAEPMALATPFETIAKTIFDQNKNEREKMAAWENGQLLYNDLNNRIIVSHSGNGGLGGETGNGGLGGETGNGGGANSPFLRLVVSDVNGLHSVKTWNPFIYRSSKFNFNGENIAAMDILGKFQLPSLPLYLFNEKRKIDHSFLVSSEDTLSRLHSKRLQNIPKLSFGRLFLYNEEMKYYSIHKENSLGKHFDGTQELKPLIIKRLADVQLNPMKLVYIYENDFSMDPDGYLYTLPYSKGFSKETILDIKIRGNTLLGKKEETGVSVETIIQGSVDLEEIKIKTIRKSKGDVSVSEIVLKDSNFNSLGSKVFTSKDNSYSAVYIYSSDDLSKLEKIYIKSNSVLMEFWVDGVMR